MITAWMLYAILVGTLLGASGWAVEKFLRSHGLPSRWVWTAALLLSALWPAGHWTWKRLPQPAPVAAPAAPVAQTSQALPSSAFALEPITVQVPRESILRRLDGPLMVAWAVATGALLLFFAFVLLRTHHLRRRWEPGTADRQSVLFSLEWGPAVVGFFRPRIVLPCWCKDLDHRALRFILEHELEHVRAGDLRLLILAGVLPILLPWHLPLWWQLARLRTAAEADCDLRVLKNNPGQTRPYVGLLLDVGGRSGGRAPLAAMLSEPYATLKRRIRIMTTPLPRRPWIRGSLLTGCGALLAALACWAPGPTDAVDDGVDATPGTLASEDADAGQGGALAERVGDAGAEHRSSLRPVFTPYTVHPAVKNVDEVVATLRRAYPSEMKDSREGGTVTVWFFLDEYGRVVNTQVNKSSGHGDLDRAVLQIASVARFTPALNRDQKRPVWVSLPVVFTMSGEGESLLVESSRNRVESGETMDPKTPVGPKAPAAADPLRAADPLKAGEGSGDLAGIVRDASTGAPLRFAQVFIRGTRLGTLTNEDGRFLIRDVPAGVREVGVVLVGYGQAHQTLRVRPEARSEVDLNLQAMAIPLEPLVVRGIE